MYVCTCVYVRARAQDVYVRLQKLKSRGRNPGQYMPMSQRWSGMCVSKLARPPFRVAWPDIRHRENGLTMENQSTISLSCSIVKKTGGKYVVT